MFLKIFFFVEIEPFDDYSLQKRERIFPHTVTLPIHRQLAE